MIRKNPVILHILDELVGAQSVLQRSYSQGQPLINQGEPISSVFIIRSGIIKCSIAEDNGKEYILEFLGEGEVLGENEAICRTPGMCTVRALTDVSVYRIDKAGFLHLLETNKAFNSAILELMAVRLANTAKRAARQQLYTLDYSLDQLLAVLEWEKIPCSKQDLADYLGISLRSLNRLLKGRGGPGDDN